MGTCETATLSIAVVVVFVRARRASAAHVRVLIRVIVDFAVVGKRVGAHREKVKQNGWRRSTPPLVRNHAPT